jgi:hypothetical protein
MYHEPVIAIDENDIDIDLQASEGEILLKREYDAFF